MSSGRGQHAALTAQARVRQLEALLRRARSYIRPHAQGATKLRIAIDAAIGEETPPNDDIARENAERQVCSICGEPATKHSGDVYGAPQYRCNAHDPHGKWFDITEPVPVWDLMVAVVKAARPFDGAVPSDEWPTRRKELYYALAALDAVQGDK